MPLSAFADGGAFFSDVENGEDAITEFIGRLWRMDGIGTEFDGNLWGGMAESMTVRTDGSVRVRFKGGAETIIRT